MNENIIPSVGVLIIEDNKVLLVKHGNKAGHINDIYGLPAGRFEKGEGDEDCTLRELKEEGGLNSKRIFV